MELYVSYMVLGLIYGWFMFIAGLYLSAEISYRNRQKTESYLFSIEAVSKYKIINRIVIGVFMLFVCANVYLALVPEHTIEKTTPDVIITVSNICISVLLLVSNEISYDFLINFKEKEEGFVEWI